MRDKISEVRIKFTKGGEHDYTEVVFESGFACVRAFSRVAHFVKTAKESYVQYDRELERYIYIYRKGEQEW